MKRQILGVLCFLGLLVFSAFPSEVYSEQHPSTGGKTTFLDTVVVDTTAGVFITADPWVDVRAYGAVGDGSTNDSTAIRNAMNSLSGGTVFFPIPDSVYAFSGITIPDGKSNICLSGPNYGSVTLRYTGNTGNGITFEGEADNFTIRNLIISSPNSSTGAAIYSNQLSTSPLRDITIENVSITSFLSGIVIHGGINGKIVGGRQTGQGKAIAGGIGIQLGEDITHAFNHAIVSQVYVAAYETGIYNKYCGILHLKNPIVGTSSISLKSSPGRVTFAEGVYFDSNADTSIYNAGYTLYSGNFSSSGAQVIYSTNHRFTRTQHLKPRVEVSVMSGQTIADDDSTLVAFATENEDTEGYFNNTADIYKFITPHAGYYVIEVTLQWNATADAKLYGAYIYADSVLVAESYNHSAIAATLPLTTSVNKLLWLNTDTYIQGFGYQNSGGDQNILPGATKSFMSIIEF